jgi:hypothetical protein
LTWDTPFDDKALQLGIFKVKNTVTSEEIPSLDMKINRKLPPPREAFLEVKAHHAITKEIVVAGPAMQLENGVEYEVQAKGRMKAVWHASVEDIGDENLKKMGGGTGVTSFDFESDVVRIQA